MAISIIIARLKILEFLGGLSFRKLIVGFFIFCVTCGIWEVVKPRLFKIPKERKALKKGMDFEKTVMDRIQKEFGVTPFRGLLFPVNNQETTETDLVLLTDRGLFCIECKCWGDEFDRLGIAYTQAIWTLYGKYKGAVDRFNPLQQNARHLGVIRNILFSQEPLIAQKLRYYNIVCIQNPFTVSEDGYVTPETNYHSELDEKGICFISTRMTNGTDAINVFHREIDMHPAVLSADECKRVADILSRYIPTQGDRDAHVNRLKRKYEGRY